MSRFDLPKPPTEDPDLPAEVQLAELQQWAVQIHQALSALLRDMDQSFLRTGMPVKLPDATVAQLTAGLKFRPGEGSRMVFVVDEVGGAVPAFSDGTDWRRCSDRSVVS